MCGSIENRSFRVQTCGQLVSIYHNCTQNISSILANALRHFHLQIFCQYVDVHISCSAFVAYRMFQHLAADLDALYPSAPNKDSTDIMRYISATQNKTIHINSER